MAVFSSEVLETQPLSHAKHGIRAYLPCVYPF